MKLKIFILSFLFFLFAVPCFAYDFEEYFESYPDGYAMDNEPNWICPNWVIEENDILSTSTPNSLWKPNAINNDLTLNLDGKAIYGSFYNRNHGVAPIYYRYYDTSASTTLESFQIRHEISSYLRFYLQTKYGSVYLTAQTGYDYKHIEWEISSDKTNVRMRYQDGAWTNWVKLTYGLPDRMYIDIPTTYATHLFYDNVVFNYALEGVQITSPQSGASVIDDSWITVHGVCPTNGIDRIGFTNNCLGFDNIEYTVDCVDGEFSGQFYKSGLSDRIIARDKSSVSGDCADYDDLMDFIEVDGFEVIEGYPDEWYFNYDYYDDYDIKIISPNFDMPSLTLPKGSSDVNMTFSFTYPAPLSPNLVFNMKQYDKDGNLLNASYHNKALYQMTDPKNYIVNLTASSSAIHYVVQLLNNGSLVRQYPFGVFTSDLDIIVNPDEYYLFPRLVENLKKKVVFNYYFAFYDGFYSLFNGSIPTNPDDALDITFKSVSGNKQYNLEVPVFKGSDASVKTFTNGLRPYITAFIWLVFALYVVIRINGLFNNDE